jgi:hypothetical protein
MTRDTLQSKPFPDLAAAEAAPGALPPGALLRALLAGAVALLVLLLPAQVAASRGGDDGGTGCRNRACASGDRTALHGPSDGTAPAISK